MSLVGSHLDMGNVPNFCEPVVCCDVGDNGGKNADLERIVSGDRDVVFAGWEDGKDGHVL